ncbi:polymorphic toxin-type HINT domain-containing protein [Winogradskyella sp.]|uniref:polymorphic toxin-type HINT domain-containing protein n=1 Tax=Winogradskyella sp. TaxID=1883156 RepID=UPI003BAC80B7
MSTVQTQNLPPKFQTSIEYPNEQTTIAIGTTLPLPYADTGVTEPNTDTYEPETFLHFFIDNDDTPSLVNYSTSIELQITPFLSDGSSDTSYTKTFVLDYAVDGSSGNTIDQIYHKIDGRYGVNVQIINITTQQEGNTTNTLPDNVRLTLGYVAYKIKALAANAPPISTGDITYNASTNEYILKWGAVEGAVSYDLEWSWYDNYDRTPDMIPLTLQDFKNNSTRINTDQREYAIANIFGKGHLAFRVRAVGMAYSGGEYFFEQGNWSFQSQNASHLEDWNDAFITLTTGHEINKNWQFQASYAEEGKKKEVVSYFDGTLRNRQTVTRINTDNNAIVGEVIYDNQGRPAIEVLPVPASFDKNKLGFHQNFNLNINGDKYSHLDFDWDSAANDVCGIAATQMSPEAGASKYYSRLNTSTSQFRDYIPDALNYPFSQIIYTDDNTGRIKKKGGLGLTHQINSGHEMQYVYAKPIQNELDRLFGYQVGLHNHYKKNAVVDPNKQVSVSYIDPQGRTIATALVADNPPALTGLDDEEGINTEDGIDPLTHGLTTQDILNNTSYNSNQFPGLSISDGLKTQMFKAVVSESNAHTMSYSLGVTDIFQPDCFAEIAEYNGKGYPFVFDLGLDAITECGDSLLSNALVDNIQSTEATSHPLGYATTQTQISVLLSYDDQDDDPLTNDETLIPYDAVDLVSPLGSTQQLFSDNFTTVPAPPIGNLQILKTLKVNKNALDKFADDWIVKVQQSDSDCILDLGFFNPDTGIDGCFSSCQECEDAIAPNGGGLQEYIDTNLLEYTETLATVAPEDLTFVTNALTERFQREYELLVEACNSNCQTDGVGTTDPNSTIQSISCDVKTLIIKADMELGGQYGNSPEIDDTDLLSIYNEQNLLANPFITTLYDNLYSGQMPDFFSWRTPFNLEFPSDPFHYYDENGSIVYISVPLDENGESTQYPLINPIDYPFIDANPLITEDPLNEGYGLVEPHFLLNFSDFDYFYTNHWAYSLMAFHPEYSYVDFAFKLCEVISLNTLEVTVDSNGDGILETTTAYVNIDGFKNYLENLDYNAALGKGYLTEATITNLLLDDPLYNAFPVDLAAELGFPSLPDFQTFIENNFLIASSNAAIAYESILTVVCNSISECSYNDYNSAFAALQTQEDKEEFWDVYLNSYLNFRDRVISALSNIYAINNNTYNNCIGEGLITDDDPLLRLNVAFSVSTNQSSGAVCGDNAGLYFDKIKRIVSEDYLYDSSASAVENSQDLEELTDYNYYIDTGQCPMGRDFEFFVNGLFEDVNSDGSLSFSTNPYQIPYNDSYLSMDLYLDLGGLPTYVEQSGVFVLNVPNSNMNFNFSSPSNSELYLNITSSNTTSILTNNPILFYLQDNNYSWSNYNNTWIIKEISQFNYEGYTEVNPIEFGFLMTVKIANPSQPDVIIEEIIISGKTIARIGECYINGGSSGGGPDDPVGEGPLTGGPLNDDECQDADDFTEAILNLLNSLNNSNEIFNQNISLNTTGLYSANDFLPTFLGDTNLGATWSYDVSTHTGTIAIGLTEIVSIPLNSVLYNDINSGDFIVFHRIEFADGNLDELQIIYSSLESMTIYGTTYTFAIPRAIYSNITALDYNCCSYIESNNPCGVLDSDGDGIGDLCDDDNGCGDTDSDGDGIGDLCDPIGCTPLNCDTALIGLMNFLLTQGHIYDSSYNITSNVLFYATCLDEFYQINLGDSLVWEFNDPSNNFVLRRNGVLIVELLGVGPGDINNLDVSSFTSINLIEVDGTLAYTDSLNNPNSFIYKKGAFQCDMNDLCEAFIGVDSDDDDVDDGCDNCWKDGNTDQADSDDDGVGNVCDSCPNAFNIGDTDNDGIDDACDPEVMPAPCIADIENNKAIFSNGMIALINQVKTNNDPNGIGNFVVTSYLTNDLRTFFESNAKIIFNDPNYAFSSVNWTYPYAIDNEDYLKLEFSGASNYYVLVKQIDFSDDYLSITPLGVLPNTESIYFIGQLPVGNIPSSSTLLFYQTYGNITSSQYFPLNFSCNLDTIVNSPTAPLVFSKSISVISSKSIVDDDSCEVCIPQSITPVPWSESIYQNTFVANLQNVVGYEIPSQYSWEYFSDRNYQYILEGYIEYLTVLSNGNLSTLSTEHPLFLTISGFGATPLNYGYDDYNSVIAAYQPYMGLSPDGINDDPETPEIEGFLVWRDFAAHYVEINSICPPDPMPANIDIPPYDGPSDCEQFATNVSEAYGADNYAEYINRLKRKFKIDYINAALQSVEESFTLQYEDKEYQYTLYYYDQAGNLIQTVPPQGANRVEFNALSPDIATIRDSGEQTPDETVLPNHFLKTQYRYNSLNQLVWQKTPDGGETRFAYDDLGRIIASQNEKQAIDNILGQTEEDFSYTTYDGLGRIIEAGEVKLPLNEYIINDNGRLEKVLDGTEIDTEGFPYDISTRRREVTQTFYDDAILVEGTANTMSAVYSNDLFTSGYTLYNSINRVTAVLYFDELTTIDNSEPFDNGLFYNYDVHGNVKELITYITSLKIPNCIEDANTLDCEAHLRRIHYDYDLISGNVHEVKYQPNKPDQFLHRYAYDDDNRIMNVKTSENGVIWEEDANYQYYEHGPLARALLGDKQVQGMDYVYTIQGWLKGVNSEEAGVNDVGNDLGTITATDAFAYSLNYFNGDYETIGGTNPFRLAENGTYVNTNNLYNGNIKTMVTSLIDMDENPLSVLQNNYTYDQLNRIKSMDSYDVGNDKRAYASTYNYDRNGNLTDLTRSVNDVPMDNFSYQYNTDVQDKALRNNRLYAVTENLATDNAFDSDIDTGQNIGVLNEDTGEFDGILNPVTSLIEGPNYQYDAIGQLIKDEQEGISNIDWRVDGKVRQITKADGTTISFDYDGLGNRLSKTTVPQGDAQQTSTNYYIRDAQGNTMAIYFSGAVISSGGSGNAVDFIIPADVVHSGTELIQASGNIIAAQSGGYTITPTGNVTLQAGNSITLHPGTHIQSGANAHLFIDPSTTSIVEIVDLELSEHHLYGSSRLGLQKYVNDLTAEDDDYENTVGDKRYELSNHLGNVLAVITDQKLYDSGIFKPNVIAYNDYYPFGMLMPNRHGSTDTYRYGFNGKEKDDEVKGEGLQVDYGFRIYDPRLGKFLSTDPLFKGYPFYTPYQFASNTPISAIDIDGLESDKNFNEIEKDFKRKYTSNPGDKFMQIIEDLFAWKDANSEEELERAYEKSKAAQKKIDAMVTFTNSLVTTTKQAADFVLPLELYENLATGKNLDGTEAQWYDYLINTVGILPGPGKLGKGFKFAAKYGDEFVDVTEHVVKVANKLCFVAGTQVLAENEYENIEDIQVGDYVWSFNENLSKNELKKVTKTFKSKSDHIRTIETDKNIIKTTDEHPFYVSGIWKEAKYINVGDSLTLKGFSKEVVLKVGKINKPVEVYNFEVEGNHSYFVTKSNILVHNLCFKVKWGAAVYPLSPYKTAIEHIIHRHGFKSTFADKNLWTQAFTENIGKLKNVVNDAIAKAKSTKDLVIKYAEDGTRQYSVKIDVGQTVGTRGETAIEIFLDKDFNVLNAYPVGRNLRDRSKAMKAVNEANEKLLNN